ncbi:MAG: hypothetical protein RRY41_08390 [Burkholderiaceae bacterium]
MNGHHTPGFRSPPVLARGNVLTAAIISMTGLALTLVVMVNVMRWSQTVVQETAVQHINQSAERAARQSQDAARVHQERERERVANQATLERATFDAQQASTAASQSAAEHREAAWRRFYQPSAACANPDTRPLVECANEHIRARRAFDLQYKPLSP